MLIILNIVLPVFALVGIGYGAVRFKLFPSSGIAGIIFFVNNYAAPCLLFQAVVSVDFGAVFDPRVIGGFYLSSFLAMGLGALFAFVAFGTRGPRTVVAGFAAAFTNALLLGVPVIQRAFGDEALPIIYSIIALQAPVLLTFATVVIEFLDSGSKSFGATLKAAFVRVFSNPLVMGIVLGVLVNVTNMPLPTMITDVVSMMARAMLPTALFGLGGALNAYSIRENWQQSVSIAMVKLIVHPTLAWVILVPIFGVPYDFARYVVLLAAMPAGFNTYILATRTNHGVDIAANSILLSTIGAVFSVSIWLYVLTP